MYSIPEKHPQSEFCTLKKWFSFARRAQELQCWRQDSKQWWHYVKTVFMFFSPIAFVLCFLPKHESRNLAKLTKTSTWGMSHFPEMVDWSHSLVITNCHQSCGHSLRSSKFPKRLLICWQTCCHVYGYIISKPQQLYGMVALTRKPEVMCLFNSDWVSLECAR